ncbi:MAG: potassium/proton antiporter [Planctomycetaceae bacterium]|nr:potassium/proton antiporter [Planctomycetaceae bacterium]
MSLVDSLILVTGVLLLLGIASSKFSARLGVPVLVLFLGLGMLAGSDGIGGIAFENYSLAFGIGTLALAVILFDGGLQTPMDAVRTNWKPAVVLATAGVLVTALVTGLAAAWILEIPLLEGLLLGSIVGSTDAAAVFAVLRSGGVRLSERLTATLELESGSNDPMAIFLTISCIELLLGQVPLGTGLLILFVRQTCVGAFVGIAVGYWAVWVINRINLPAAGLYPVLVTAFGLLTFGLAAWLGGSGFLAIYLAGIVIGNNRIVFQRGIFLFHDAVAWLAQIVLFIMLGLLSFPSRLLAVSVQGLLIGAVLIVFARPIAVVMSVLPFRFHWRELLFISWVGLKGAVPITLATFPLLAGVDRAPLLFDVVFFVVVVSAVLQGSSLPFVARWLKLELPAVPDPPVTLEISSMRHVEGDIVDYSVGADSLAAGRMVKDLALPEGVVIALIARHEQIIPPQGRTQIEPGDHVIIVLRPGTRPLVDQVFARQVAQRAPIPVEIEFPLRASITVGELEDFYAIKMNAPRSSTLDEAVRQHLDGQPLSTSSIARFGEISLHVRELTAEGTVQQVGMVVLPQD